MTARPPALDLSAEEAAVVARFGIFAEEEQVERVARAIWETGRGFRSPWAEISELTRERHRERAVSVLAAHRSAALARVGALAAQLDTEAHARPDGWVLAGIARRIREALRG